MTSHRRVSAESMKRCIYVTLPSPMLSNVTPQHHLHELRDPDNGDMRRKRLFAPGGASARSQWNHGDEKNVRGGGGEFRQKSKSSLSWKRPARCDVIDILMWEGLVISQWVHCFLWNFPCPTLD